MHLYTHARAHTHTHTHTLLAHYLILSGSRPGGHDNLHFTAKEVKKNDLLT
jgi:hypothetical protein